MPIEPMTLTDEASVIDQLERRPRGVIGVAYRCPAGHPAVLATRPRLADGTPFPTTFYLTCPRAVTACSTLEAEGLMTELTARVAADPDLAARYASAHRAYLTARARLAGDIGEVAEIAQVSAGGMPSRVKCLHALLAHTLAAGAGINPIGDDTLCRIRARWPFPCSEGVGGTERDTERVGDTPKVDATWGVGRTEGG
ncbi:MAG: DUF501 domain-containing protein [Microlunatus sp.]|nr:DUF501 domain-containing protein [Microlunatus sp.]MDN5769895.1 DUF501 domain-containing protein [Microlunatus sp.]